MQRSKPKLHAKYEKGITKPKMTSLLGMPQCSGVLRFECEITPELPDHQTKQCALYRLHAMNAFRENDRVQEFGVQIRLHFLNVNKP